MAMGWCVCCDPGKVKGGREAVCGETILPDVGLVGDLKLGGNEGGELDHCSMCSGLMAGLEGLGGRGFSPCWEDTDGDVVEECGVGVLSLGVVTSFALD